ncbi:hypothetical protein [Thermophilibacter sp.]
MLLPVDRLTALRALRVYRRAGGAPPAERIDLPEPDASPRTRWTPGLIPIERLALAEPPDVARPIEVAAPSAASRLRGSFVRCSVRSTSLPPRSFVSLGDGLVTPCPELLFLELADVMTPAAHALLGYELCGTYARDPADPRLSDVVHGLRPVTTTERIARYLDEVGRRPGSVLARRNLAHVADNAWSPMEAIVAFMARLPVHELGYELGGIVLNERHEAAPQLVQLGIASSRVPDIEVVGTHVGFNYDSHAHLDLDAIVEAALSGDASDSVREVREGYLDDIRRNRELAAQGRIILPVTPEDLFARGGLDAVMLEAAQLANELGDSDDALGNVAVALDPSYARPRQLFLWSLLPWPPGVGYARAVRGMGWRGLFG